MSHKKPDFRPTRSSPHLQFRKLASAEQTWTQTHFASSQTHSTTLPTPKAANRKMPFPHSKEIYFSCRFSSFQLTAHSSKTQLRGILRPERISHARTAQHRPHHRNCQ
jgi:hypothetical protein